MKHFSIIRHDATPYGVVKKPGKSKSQRDINKLNSPIVKALLKERDNKLKIIKQQIKAINWVWSIRDSKYIPINKD